MWVFASHVESWMFESQPWQTLVVKTGKNSAIYVSGVLGDDHYKRMSRVTEPLIFNGHQCRAKVKICSPSPAMLRSKYEWKILELDDKLPPKTQTKSHEPKSPSDVFWSIFVRCPSLLSLSSKTFHKYFFLSRTRWPNFNQTNHKAICCKGDSSLFYWRDTLFIMGT